jgi:hypothetical protein
MKLTAAHVALLLLPNDDGTYLVYAAQASMHVAKLAVKRERMGAWGASRLQ